jgi:hypothetical protein
MLQQIHCCKTNYIIYIRVSEGICPCISLHIQHTENFFIYKILYLNDIDIWAM